MANTAKWATWIKWHRWCGLPKVIKNCAWLYDIELDFQESGWIFKLYTLTAKGEAEQMVKFKAAVLEYIKQSNNSSIWE